MLRRVGVVIAMVASLVGLSSATSSAMSSATPGYCGIDWGSAAKSATPTGLGEMAGLRAGRNDCYDRLVFDVRGPVDGYWVSYVDTVTVDPTGAPVPLRGGAKLAISVQAPSYTASGAPTWAYSNPAELVNVAGFQTFRQVAWAGSFEGSTSVGLGVRARLPFRVFTLPGRVVIDVAHFW
jgi:hypothetical protein